MTTDEACDAVALLLASYPTQRQRMTREDAAAMTRAYVAALVDLDSRVAMAAISALVLTERWIPTIAQVRAKASELRDGRKREGGEAWGDVLAAMKRYGRGRSPGVDFRFQDPIVGRCVKALDWTELCASDNTVADRARFIDLYNQLASADASDRAIGQALPTATVSKALPSGTKSLADLIPMALASAKEPS